MRRVLLTCLVLSTGAAMADPHHRLPIADLEARLTTQPFTILSAKQSRPLREDVALRAEVRFADGVELRVKLRRANPGGAEFNNEPRYESAAYELQKLFLDPPEYVVPPTALRALPVAALAPHTTALPTFRGADGVVTVVQYWLDAVAGPAETFDAARFAAEPSYARHAAQLNLLTHLIRHGDSNAGNILVSADPASARFFLVDSGIAFDSADSDRGIAWRPIRVPHLPADTVARLRTVDRARLDRHLAVLAQWEVRDGRLEPMPLEAPFRVAQGVRKRGTQYQLGLSRRELDNIHTRLTRLLADVDAGRIAVR